MAWTDIVLSHTLHFRYNMCRGFVNPRANFSFSRDSVWSNTWFICLYRDLCDCFIVKFFFHNWYLMQTFLIILCFFFCYYVRWYINSAVPLSSAMVRSSLCDVVLTITHSGFFINFVASVNSGIKHYHSPWGLARFKFLVSSANKKENKD